MLPVPLTAPKGVKCRALSSTSLRVEWRAMSESDLRGPLVQYNIYYQRTTSNRPQRASSGIDKQGRRMQRVLGSISRAIHCSACHAKREFLIRANQRATNPKLLLLIKHPVVHDVVCIRTTLSLTLCLPSLPSPPPLNCPLCPPCPVNRARSGVALAGRCF